MKKIYKNLENFTGFLPNVSYFFSSNLVSHFFSFFIIVYFARSYAPREFGEFTIAQTVFFLIYSISFSNIHYYLNKSLSLNFQNRKKDIASCFLITFYTSVCLYLILAIILSFLNISQSLKNLILIINLILISEPFSIFYSELFVRGQFKIIFKIKVLQSFIFFTLKALVIYYNYNIIYLGLVYFLENLFFCVIVIYYYKKNGNNISSLIFSKVNTLAILKKIMLFPLLSFAILVSMRIDVLMISKILGINEAGYYSSVSRIVTIILLFGTSFFQFIYPNMNRILPKAKSFLEIYQNLVIVSLFVSFLFYIFSITLGEEYLLLFGKDFLIVYNSLIILSGNIFLALIYNLWVHKQYMETNYLEILIFQIGTIILNVVMNYYFINNFGINGAALSTLLSGTISFLIINISKPQEIYLILSAFSFSRQKNMANRILQIIFVKKNPDKLENTRD